MVTMRMILRWCWYSNNYVYICVCGAQKQCIDTGKYQHQNVHQIKLHRIDDKTDDSWGGRRNTAMFTVILVLRCATATLATTHMVWWPKPIHRWWKIMTRKKCRWVHQATTTDNQANNINDDYALTITEVLISGTVNTYETILHI